MVEKRQVFSVGDLCIDVLQEIKNPVEFGKEHSLKDLNFSIGGNAANFAVIGSKLGFKPKLLSAIGKDFATSFLKKNLSKANVKRSLISCNERNAFSIILVDRRGERAIQSTKSCLKELTAKRIEKMLLPGLTQGDVVFFGGFYHLPNLRSGFKTLLKKIKKHNVIVCFDTCFDTKRIWSISQFLPFIDFLFVNDLELKHIAKGSTMQKRVVSLFNKGSNVVVVKQAGKGASLFVKDFKPEQFKSVAGKVVDTTGAGDAFNAGFVLGLMNDWSLDNCMRSGNFVAAKKVQVHGLAAPSVSAVKHFISIHNKPTLVVARNYDELSKVAAQHVINLLKRKPNASIALPTGKTPKKLYKLLVSAYKKGKVNFSKASFFALDEYVGLKKSDKNSFSYFLMNNFLSKVNARKQNIHLLDGSVKNLKKEAAKYETVIGRKGIDLCILGIGENGHVAFNEPGSCSYGLTRLVKLKHHTRKVNGGCFSENIAPLKAITVGLKTIRENSAEILLLASGKHKRKAVLNTLKSKDFMKWPAVALKPHKNFMVIADKAVAGKKRVD